MGWESHGQQGRVAGPGSAGRQPRRDACLGLQSFFMRASCVAGDIEACAGGVTGLFRAVAEPRPVEGSAARRDSVACAPSAC